MWISSEGDERPELQSPSAEQQRTEHVMARTLSRIPHTQGGDPSPVCKAESLPDETRNERKQKMDKLAALARGVSKSANNRSDGDSKQRWSGRGKSWLVHEQQMKRSL